MSFFSPNFETFLYNALVPCPCHHPAPPLGPPLADDYCVTCLFFLLCVLDISPLYRDGPNSPEIDFFCLPGFSLSLDNRMSVESTRFFSAAKSGGGYLFSFFFHSTEVRSAVSSADLSLCCTLSFPFLSFLFFFDDRERGHRLLHNRLSSPYDTAIRNRI